MQLHRIMKERPLTYTPIGPLAPSKSKKKEKQ